jgi:hypothetical protein
LLIFLQKPPFNIFIVHDLTHHASAKFDMMIQQAGEALAEQDTARAAARNASTIAKTATKTADTQAAAQAKKMAKKWKKPVGVSDPHQSSMTMPSFRAELPRSTLTMPLQRRPPQSPQPRRQRRRPPTMLEVWRGIPCRSKMSTPPQRSPQPRRQRRRLPTTLEVWRGIPCRSKMPSQEGKEEGTLKE